MTDTPADRDASGYRPPNTTNAPLGPKIRSDVVDVYIVRTSAQSRFDLAFIDSAAAPNTSSPADVELLQLQRSRDPLRGTWQPVMGHIEPGETAVHAAIRETLEETGLHIDLATLKQARLSNANPNLDPCLGMWALEQVHPFYIAAIDCIVLSPRFVVLVNRAWQPVLNAEHTASRWVSVQSAGSHFTWPGQLASIAELRTILNPGHPGHVLLRL